MLNAPKRPKILPCLRAPRFLRAPLIAPLIVMLLSPLVTQTAQAAETPLYGSTADTVFDIITTSDPSTFNCLSYEGRTIRQMWDKRLDNEFDLNVFLFHAHFTDSPPIDIIVNPEFETVAAAEAEARRYTTGLGQLPLIFRHGIRQLGIHGGMPTYSAGAGKIFVYADRTTRRIGQNHLEESLLHESVHTSLDPTYARSPEWQAAQEQDGAFLTRYGMDHPQREDLAETALFAYGLQRHPNRIPPVDNRDIRRAIPARLALLETILNEQPQVSPAPTPPVNCH
jgi:hypothetical protein